MLADWYAMDYTNLLMLMRVRLSPTYSFTWLQLSSSPKLGAHRRMFSPSSRLQVMVGLSQGHNYHHYFLNKYFPTLAFPWRRSSGWRTFPQWPECPHYWSRRWCSGELKVEIKISFLKCLNVQCRVTMPLSGQPTWLIESLSPTLSTVQRGEGEAREQQSNHLVENFPPSC